MRVKLPHRELTDAFAALGHAAAEAEEEGFPMPSDVAVVNAKRLLHEMYAITPQRFEVYPTPDAEIAIRALAPGRSVIVLCESDGEALCLANLNNGRRRMRYDCVDVLPDRFLKKALLDLKSEDL